MTPPAALTSSPSKQYNYPSHPWTFSSAPPDPILQLAELVHQDSNPNTLDLAIGAYRDANGKPHQFRAVTSFSSSQFQTNQTLSRQYLPADGDRSFTNAAINLIYDHQSIKTKSNIAAVHTVSASAALRIALEFARRALQVSTVYVSKPSWANHSQLVSESKLKLQEYRYYDPINKQIDIQGLLNDLNKASRGSLILLQPCAHNPSGMDLSKEHWYSLLSVIRTRSLIPLFDMAYQGLASGDIEEDASPIRLFTNAGIHTLVAQSFSKNLGLYNSRVGTLSVYLPITDGVEKLRDAVISHLKWIIRAMYSSPPAEGARIARAVIENQSLNKEWRRELSEVVIRLQDLRLQLYQTLVNRQIPGQWNHIVRSRGMFVLLGLAKEQVTRLRVVHHVYMTDNSRINIAGLTVGTIEQLVDAISEVVEYFGSCKD